MARFALFAAIAMLMGAAFSVRAEKVANLTPRGYVSDFAEVLSPAAKTQLTNLCAELDQKTRAQVAIVTIRSLEGEPIEQFSIDLATKWGVGPKQDATGVMVLLATDDHKYRIEVGYGLEPILPDGKVGGFGREARPLLQRGDYDGALLLLTRRIAGVIAQDHGVGLDTLTKMPLPAAPPAGPGGGAGIPVDVIVFLILLAFPLLGWILRAMLGTRRGYRGGGGWWLGGGPWYGGWGGSGWRGGGWGGGGFGGSSGGGGFGGFGGGSFGGGGASGSW